jgi:IclR family mhp operon transcriptional activator
MDSEGAYKRIRALDRGLSVVEHLSRHGLSSLSVLRKSTGLSNATLLRVLATLQARGWVRRNIIEGQYELAHSLGELLGKNARAHPVAEQAAPILLTLRQRQIGLPSDVATIVGPGTIEIIESTRLRGPMAPARTSLGIRPSMVFSAHGRAFLAVAPPLETRLHLSVLRANGTKKEVLWIDSGKLEEELARTRARGYGLREPEYWVDTPLDQGPDLGAMAVPIPSATGVHGTLSLLWIRDDMTLDEVLALGSLQDMRVAVVRIGAALDRNAQVAPTFAVPDIGSAPGHPNPPAPAAPRTRG